MSKQLAFTSVAELAALVKEKKISPQELAQYFKKRLEKFASLGATLQVYEKFDLPNISHDNQNSLMFGVPGLRKDNICHAGKITSCASKILANYQSPYSATVIEKLENAGAAILGSCNMDEFAMGSSTETSAFFKAKNPWDQTRVPGGSSGGSAVAVAAGLAPWSLGSETGGSVRQPAALTGIVGLKPTYGAISRYGLIAYASSLDQVGVFTRTVEDNSLVYRTIAGHDLKDSTSLPVPVDHSDITKLPENLTLGYIENAVYADGVDPEIKQAFEEMIKVYEKLGVKIKKIKLSSLEYSSAAYFIISRAEAASNLARFDGVRYGLRVDGQSLNEMYCKTRHEGFGQEVRLRIIAGNYVLSAGHADQFYRKAKNVQAWIKNEIREVLTSVDAFILPVHAAPAFKFGAFDDNKLQMDLQDYYTCFVNLAGVPALALPCGMSSDKLPIGFQIVGSHGAENLLFKLGHAYEKETPWHLMHPHGFAD
jgi:aspartyl-tRNA(Asn)/glutamyl-tRNA(Gln) amidotransferase subunit A